jgi:4-amino-4-deoxy-L-arabinose transferase-like glycosyltransferase
VIEDATRDRADRRFHRGLAQAVTAVRSAAAAAVVGIRRHPLLAGALLVYGVLLIVFRPASPYEWDEVLFLRSLDDYNVATHSPHPPGYPLFVGVAKAVRFLVHDPVLALQFVSVLAAVGAVALTYFLTLRLSAARPAAVAAATLVALTPAFAFYANVGMADVIGTAGGVASVLALVAASERSAALPWAGAVSALALGARPQLAPLLLPLWVVVLVKAMRRGDWRRLAVTCVISLVATDLIWLPAIGATGPGFWAAWRDHARTLAAVETGLRLPGARLSELSVYWFVQAFGSPSAAAWFWALVALGAVAWLHARKRLLVGVCTSAVVAYIAVGVFTMNMTTANRYLLPVLPFLAVLAAGLATMPWRAVRWPAVAALAGWAATALYWAAPVYVLRRQPAPVWAGLSLVRQAFDPTRTTVVYDGLFEPQVRYLLQPAGFTIQRLEPSMLYGGWLRPGGAVVLACTRRVAGGDVLFSSRWTSEKLRTLTRDRYNQCSVTRAPEPGMPVYSPEWRVSQDDWELAGTGAICLALDARPRTVVLQAGDSPLRLQRAGGPPLTVKAGVPLEATLMPGPAGCLYVNGPGSVRSQFPPVQSSAIGANDQRDEVTSASIVPLVAGLSVPGEAQWKSDVTISNLGATPLPLVAQYLPSERDNSSAPAAEFTLPPGVSHLVTDVVGSTGLLRWGARGALLVYAEQSGCGAAPCSFTVFSRTYNAAAPRTGPRIGEGLPALAARRGLYGGGRAVFDHVSNDGAYHSFVTIATWIPTPVHALVTLRDRDKQVVGTSELDLPAFGQKLVPFPGTVTDGQLSVQLVKQPAQALFYPVVTMVETVTGEPTHLLATPSRKEAPPEWLALRPARLPIEAGGSTPPGRGVR